MNLIELEDKLYDSIIKEIDFNVMENSIKLITFDKSKDLIYKIHILNINKVSFDYSVYLEEDETILDVINEAKRNDALNLYNFIVKDIKNNSFEKRSKQNMFYHKKIKEDEYNIFFEVGDILTCKILAGKIILDDAIFNLL